MIAYICISQARRATYQLSKNGRQGAKTMQWFYSARYTNYFYVVPPVRIPLILVHDVPYWNRLKSSRTHLLRPVFGMVMIAGQVRPWRQSSGTQNKGPSVPCTHPSGFRLLMGMGRPERAGRDRRSLEGWLE
jgi:hypothetical protein